MAKRRGNPNGNPRGNPNGDRNGNPNNGQWQSQNSGGSNQNHRNRGGINKNNNRGGWGQADGRGRGGRGRGDRGRGGRGRGGQGRNSGNFTGDPQAFVPWINNTQNYKGEELDELSVKGLQESTATGQPGGGVPTLITFLERKSGNSGGEPAKVIKSRVEGDLVIVSVRPHDTAKILRFNVWTFWSATLSIALLPNSASLMNSTSLQDSEGSGTAISKELLLGTIYQRRYNAETKFLDLSELDKDPDLASAGLFDPDTRGMKLFPALMKICDDMYPTAASKQAGIVSVSLAKNHLTDISRVATLAQHCPSIRNLDLSQNRLTGLADLEGWRWAFRNLDHLILSDNPIQSSEPEHNVELQRWFPSLTILNNILLESSEELPEELSMDDVNKASTKRILPVSTQRPVFRDEESIAKSFLQEFFPTFDGDRKGDRNSLVNEVYDERSTFSLSINTSAPRVHEVVGHKPRNWASYIRKFRNVMRVSEQPATTPRLFKGTESIRHIFTALPATRHPDVLTESHKWWSEYIPIPGLSDPAGKSGNGWGGLLIMAHGEFLDVDGPNNNQHASTLSFDRTFLLGPSKAIGGIRIACDVLMLRSYGGKDTWPVEQEVSIPPGFAVEAPDKSDMRLEMEKTVLQFSMKTGLTLEFSDLCLCKNDWSVPQASMAFEQARSTLPPHVWNPC